MSSSSSTSTVGGKVTFTGSVAPDKAGHVIYLQRLGADGDWHTVEVRTVAPGSTFSFGWTFGTAGTKQFRARILGGPENVGAASSRGHRRGDPAAGIGSARRQLDNEQRPASPSGDAARCRPEAARPPAARPVAAGGRRVVVR